MRPNHSSDWDQRSQRHNLGPLPMPARLAVSMREFHPFQFCFVQRPPHSRLSRAIGYGPSWTQLSDAAKQVVPVQRLVDSAIRVHSGPAAIARMGSRLEPNDTRLAQDPAQTHWQVTQRQSSSALLVQEHARKDSQRTLGKPLRFGL